MVEFNRMKKLIILVHQWRENGTYSEICTQPNTLWNLPRILGKLTFVIWYGELHCESVNHGSN